MRFEYGSAYDDDAANEGRPAYEADAERRPDLMLTDGTGSPAAKLTYVRFSPDSSSREILVLLGKRRWGSLSFDLCRRCRRGHIWSLSVLAVMQGEGLETRMLRMARSKAPEDYRWTRSGLASGTREFWEHIPPELSGQPEVPCEHLDWRPGRLRDAWACLRYWRLTRHLYWPDSRVRHSAVRKSSASRNAAPERLQAQLEQARQERDADERAAAEAARDGVPSEARRARKARKNAVARIEWLGKRIDELDGYTG
ncbi:MAG TPA: hypothetical protein VGI31_02625 [Streptosporangiaceae bacterium]